MKEAKRTTIADLVHPCCAGEVRTLLDAARENPWWEFTGEEIARLMGLSETTVAMLKRTEHSPFIAGRSRPERVAAFFGSHPGWKPTAEKLGKL